MVRKNDYGSVGPEHRYKTVSGNSKAVAAPEDDQPIEAGEVSLVEVVRLVNLAIVSTLCESE